jgi:acetaldehyde dehydrogenase (acetylating)
VLDRRTIRQENLPPELVEQEVRDGYLRGDDPEPSTILMTTMAATMGTTQAIAYLLNQANVWDEQVIFNLWSCELHRNSPARETECRCQHGPESPDVPLLSSLSL